MLGQAISFRFRNTRDVTSQNLSMYIESYAAMHQLRIWNTFQHLSTCAIMFSHFYRWETTMRKHGEIHQHPQQLPTFRCQGSEMSLSRCKREICSWPALDDKNHLLTLEVKHTPELNFLSEILNKKHWICGITTGGNVEKISIQITTGQCQANHFLTQVSRILASSSSQTHEMINPNASNCYTLTCIIAKAILIKSQPPRHLTCSMPPRSSSSRGHLWKSPKIDQKSPGRPPGAGQKGDPRTSGTRVLGTKRRAILVGKMDGKNIHHWPSLMMIVPLRW